MENIEFIVDRTLIKIASKYKQTMTNEIKQPSQDQISYEKEMSYTLGIGVPEMSATQNTSL